MRPPLYANVPHYMLDLESLSLRGWAFNRERSVADKGRGYPPVIASPDEIVDAAIPLSSHQIGIMYPDRHYPLPITHESIGIGPQTADHKPSKRQ